MAGKKLIAVCRFGGEFVDGEDGTSTYKGGDARAIDIDDQTKFVDFKKEVEETLMISRGIEEYSVSIKYFLPFPGKPLVSVFGDNDLSRMVKLHSDSDTVDVYLLAHLHISSRFSASCQVGRGLGWITDDEIQAEFSHHEPGVARINNGSLGSCPASVIAAQSRWKLKFLRRPDHFYFHDLPSGLAESRNAVRRLVNAADVDEIVLVDNATTAVAIVMQRAAWAFSEGAYEKGSDALVVLRFAYDAVKKSAAAYFSRAGGRVVEASFGFPVESGDEIAGGLRAALREARAGGGRVRLALIDHVTSLPAVVTPIKRLVEICREEGAERVLVDGAHGPGCVHVDVQDIGADFYTGNLYKWLFCPPAVAFLHRRSQGTPPLDDLHHPIVSRGYGEGLAAEAAWVGTRDYSPMLAVPAAVEFLERFEGGVGGVRRRNHEAVVAMAEMLGGAWGTGLGCPPEMCGSMAMVGLPAALGVSTDADTLKLWMHFLDHLGVDVRVFCHDSRGYVRISHHVYNKVDDYLKLRDVVNRLVSLGFTCTSLPASK